MVRKEPPWIEDVNLTPELMYQYQISPKALSNVLKADLDFLRHTKQPHLVNDQLGELFLDLDLEGFGTKLILEEAGTNSASDSSSDGSQRYCILDLHDRMYYTDSRFFHSLKMVSFRTL